jgi:hypothetical protein
MRHSFHTRLFLPCHLLFLFGTVNFGALKLFARYVRDLYTMVTISRRVVERSTCFRAQCRCLPLDTNDFSREYRLTKFKAAMKGLVSRKVSAPFVATREPQPLQFDRDEDPLSTEIALDFRFYPSSYGPPAEPQHSLTPR